MYKLDELFDIGLFTFKPYKATWAWHGRVGGDYFLSLRLNFSFTNYLMRSKLLVQWRDALSP